MKRLLAMITVVSTLAATSTFETDERD
jgi:hypothetical protein